MKLVELSQNQEIVIQLAWNEQKIEFSSKVIEKDEAAIYVTSYIHKGHELELNVGADNNVVCNVFTDDPVTEQRISWRGVSLTTVSRNNKIVYCLKTHGYNSVSNPDDRRSHERVEIQVTGRMSDGGAGDIGVTVHDISDNGISFYIPGYYELKSQQLRISFTDTIDERIFDISAVCEVSRVSRKEEGTLIGCRVVEEKTDYRIYELLKRLRKKHHTATKKVENENTDMEEKAEPKAA